MLKKQTKKAQQEEQRAGEIGVAELQGVERCD
jgi:hypothetical protein